jgi:topoisomerase IV subunit A
MGKNSPGKTGFYNRKPQRDEDVVGEQSESEVWEINGRTGKLNGQNGEDTLNNNGRSRENDFPRIIHLSGMYKDWFLDYASYVILERAVPHLHDGLKPVQRGSCMP